MRILHTSDLHGRAFRDSKFLLSLLESPDFDLWVDTGDFFPNMTRGERAKEVEFQAEVACSNDALARFVKALAGRPVITVQGNHDYVSLAQYLHQLGAEAHEVVPEGVDVGGVRFAGFPNIPYIIGEWNHEAPRGAFRRLIYQTFDSDPDVLVTHAPPSGVLDRDPNGGWGIESLTSALWYREHKIKAHLFGHVHSSGGQMTELNKTIFSNAARGANNVIY